MRSIKHFFLWLFEPVPYPAMTEKQARFWASTKPAPLMHEMTTDQLHALAGRNEEAWCWWAIR